MFNGKVCPRGHVVGGSRKTSVEAWVSGRESGGRGWRGDRRDHVWGEKSGSELELSGSVPGEPGDRKGRRGPGVRDSSCQTSRRTRCLLLEASACDKGLSTLGALQELFTQWSGPFRRGLGFSPLCIRALRTFSEASPTGVHTYCLLIYYEPLQIG